MQKFSTKSLKTKFKTHQKDHTPWSSQSHSRVAVMVQYMQVDNVIQNINRTKDKNHMIINAEKDWQN
jgi:hypothetical protein